VKNREGDLSQKAKEYAFLLLKFRLRSEKEIFERLKRKKFPEEIIKETVAFLRQKRFLDDSLFAKAWIDSRLKRPLGLRRIRQELKLKGVERQIIESQIQARTQNYSEEEIVLEIAGEKLNKLKGVDPVKAKRRLYGYLLRRGFSPEVIIDVMGRLKSGS
jgi:regulatory protein